MSYTQIWGPWYGWVRSAAKQTIKDNGRSVVRYCPFKSVTVRCFLQDAGETDLKKDCTGGILYKCQFFKGLFNEVF